MQSDYPSGQDYCLKSNTNLVDVQKVLDLVPTLLLCIQKAQLTNKVTDLCTAPTLHIYDSFWIHQAGMFGIRVVGKWTKLMCVLQIKQCSTAASVWGEKTVDPRCDDTIQLLGYILKCITLVEREEIDGEDKLTLMLYPDR